MESADRSESAKDKAVEELRIIERANEELWFPHPSQSPIRRHPFLAGGWILLACSLLALTISYGNDDGWEGWGGTIAMLTVIGGSVAVERWLLRDRGVRLTWFPPGNVYKKSARMYWPLILFLVVPIPVGLYWLMGRAYWLTFLVLLVGMILFVSFGEYRYFNQYKKRDRP